VLNNSNNEEPLFSHCSFFVFVFASCEEATVKNRRELSKVAEENK